MNKIICLHHVDHDGHTAGAIVKRKYPDAIMHEMNYGYDIPWDIINECDEVIIVDFSLSLDEMKKIADERKLTWIDHHISIIEEAEEAGFQPEGIRFIGKAGCQLTWEYYFPDEELPTIIKYLAMYDIHDFSDTLDKLESKALVFEYGMRLYDTSPSNVHLWELIFDNNEECIKRVYKEGDIIWKYQRISDEYFIRANAFEARLGKYRCLVVNHGSGSSLAFDELWDDSKYDVMLNFHVSGHKIKVSLYSANNGPNVAELCQPFGGGGHEHASGFSIEEPIQDFYEKIGLKRIDEIKEKE